MTAQQLQDSVAPWLAALRDIRHDIHQHPEMGFEEVRTQKKVRAWLEKHGYRPRNCAGTGLVADLHDTDGLVREGGRCIALRADMDCLPMQEDTPLPYKSVHDGNAHKCGHDGHTTILMGVAAVLAQHRDSIGVNVRLLFQPSEEGINGSGGQRMVEEGALTRVDEVYGLHSWPAYTKGDVRVCAGPIMAQLHSFEIRIEGVGGHGSQPQLCRDPIAAGAYLVTALQTVVSRGLGYEGGAVVSVGSFHAGNAGNVIPGEAVLTGTIRSFRPEVTARVLARVNEIAQGSAATFGVKVTVTVEEGYPVLLNDAGCAAVVERVAQALVGADKCSAEALPMAGGEDFAYMARKTAGAYFFLGAGKPGEDTPGCHHPDFDFDDDLIELGMRMMLGIVADRG